MMARFTVIFFLIFLVLTSVAQVKEVNALGKSWYVVGMDYKLSFRAYDSDYYRGIINNLNYGNPEYKYFYVPDEELWPERNTINPISIISVAVVFRPFHPKQIPFVSEIELSHGVEFEHLNKTVSHFRNHPDHPTTAAYKSSYASYQPKLILNSPAFGQMFKCYVSGDLFFGLPLSAYVYTDPPAGILLNPGAEYSFKGTYPKIYSDRLAANTIKYGAGLSGGVKLNVDCKWNFHIDFNYQRMVMRFEQDQIQFSKYIGGSFGLRYKFGIREELEDQEKRAPSVFW